MNIDVDVYEPTKKVLEQLWRLIVPGGIIILDDYGVFPVANKAAEEFLLEKSISLINFLM